MRVISNSHVVARDTLAGIHFDDEPTQEFQVVVADDLVGDTNAQVVSESRGGAAVSTSASSYGADATYSVSATGDGAGDGDGAITADPEPTSPPTVTDPVPTGPTNDAPSSVPPVSRFNLRSNRSYDHRDGHWRTQKEQYGLHITAMKALNSYGQQAIHVMLELKQMLDKGVWEPVNVNE